MAMLDEASSTVAAHRGEVPHIDFDHNDPAFLQNPRRTFHDLHQRCPVGYSTRFDGFWVLTRYADIVAALHDTRAFSSASGVTLPDANAPVAFVPLESDPPLHPHYRRILQREFSRGRMRGVEDAIRDLTNDLIDGFAERGAADLAVELAWPIPAMIIARLMGFPRADWARFKELTERLLATSRAEDLEANFEVALEYCTWVLEVLDERRREPRDDMLTRIVEAEVEGRPITEDEALGLTMVTIIAGHETTVGGIGALLMHVAADPELKRRLMADPLLLPKAVEEAVRLETPIAGVARTVTADAEVGGQCLRQGDKVWVAFGAGNCDEAEFTEPDHFDVDRSPNRHLGFGDGIHRCVGAPLAQLEMKIVLEEVLKRIPDYRIDDPGSVIFGGGQSRMLLHLPVRWV
jgi:cytochrome P450